TGYGGLFRGMFAKAREARRARKTTAAMRNNAAPRRRRLCSFQDGMAVLPKTLAMKLGEDLLTGCEEVRIADRAWGIEDQTQSARFMVDFERAGNLHQFACDRIVIAAPATAAANLIRPISGQLSELLDEIAYPPLAIVSLAYDESAISTPLNGFGFLV